MREVSISELEGLEEGSFLLIDTRNEDHVQYGSIPGAIHIPEEALLENAERYAGGALSRPHADCVLSTWRAFCCRC